MKKTIATALGLVLSVTVTADSFVGFPKSRTLTEIVDAYAEQVALFQDYLGEPLDIRTYPMEELDVAVDIAQTGLIAASPATVIKLKQRGLIPVGYHAGRVPVGFHQLKQPAGECLKVGILPTTSLMGAMTDYLLDGYSEYPLCIQQYQDISNLGRAAMIGQVDAIVGSGLTLRRFVQSGGEILRTHKSEKSPLFAFMSTPASADRWKRTFAQLQQDGHESSSGRKIMLWSDEKELEYVRVHQLAVGDF